VRIGWIYDQALSLHTGGQMLSSRLLLERAPEWADVKIISPYHDEWLGRCDAHIVNQCRYFRPDQLAKVTEKPYIWLFHDMLHNCMHQGFILKALLKKATGCMFKSPFHRENVYGKWPEAKEVPGKAVYATPIDLDMFHPGKKTKGTIWLGNYVPEKGVREAVAWAEENGEVVDFFGFGDAFMFRICSPWVRFYPVLPYEEVPGILRQYKKLVFLPKYPEAAGRVIVEALLSGCKVITNDMIGFKSFNWWSDDPETLRKALREREGDFWGTVKKMLDV